MQRLHSLASLSKGFTCLPTIGYRGPLSRDVLGRALLVAPLGTQGLGPVHNEKCRLPLVKYSHLHQHNLRLSQNRLIAYQKTERGPLLPQVEEKFSLPPCRYTMSTQRLVSCTDLNKIASVLSQAGISLERIELKGPQALVTFF